MSSNRNVNHKGYFREPPNAIAFLIPCHRVIGKNGNLTGYRGGLALKETLLQMEGFLPKTRVQPLK